MFTQEFQEVAVRESWNGHRNGFLKNETEQMINMKETASRTNSIMYSVDRTFDLLSCKLYGKTTERVQHINMEQIQERN